MPEYPEVTVVTNSLRKLVKNEKILKVEVLNPKFIHNTTVDDFVFSVTNKTILNVQNYGKFIEFDLSDKFRIFSHLRMAGKFYVYDYNQANLDKNNKHNYVYFYLSNNKVMIYNDARQFGGFELIKNDNTKTLVEIKKLAELPGKIDVDELYQKLQKKRISIKSVLLDQNLILGIGNIYADEALFAANVYPMRKCNEVTKDELKTILENAQKIMDESIKHGGSSVHTYQSVNSKQGTYQDKLKVYGKGEKKCPKCKDGFFKKVKLDFKENGRGTTFCPICQK
ncbi:bifunctional DNA-formamidopyrimidine glycosylase/DNA-(apurinic or apyrimidinic site) lyase [Mycoplasmopsis glycophila]|uniref:Foramidopyrimidine DNA gycosylase n=1 Tax=Mycoplasmopsis glycophila TaxID=171285 RepID=A0A449AVZ2_9BACT|nr:bifunctional DNA-formamidopyrimidine glycosylase/DNA-(apurinic or apyrimidinic site) lyase [Mycoplasmopsis glycophila]VEU70814.1 foramidopyrimidine DNA gycosylase [Mycoplasmopsis glycophila]